MIIDLTMFDHEGSESSSRKSRSCWQESALLFQLIDSMPNLQHICFFADASDDTTLALLFSSLIEHPSNFPLPPITASPTPDASHDSLKPMIPFIDRLRSFSWRQRADPPAGFKRFYQASTFVSTFHLLRHAHRLSFLVLDADMDEMGKEDVFSALKELKLRTAPVERSASEVSLMLCGPIRGWEDGFLQGMVDNFRGIKELFIDRPLYKSKEAHGTTAETFVSVHMFPPDDQLELLSPLSQLPHLQLLQVGSYTFSSAAQAQIVKDLALNNQSLTVVGLLGEMGDTTWWGVWRRNSTAKRPAVSPSSSLKLLFPGDDLRMIAPLEDGHLAMLEEEVAEFRLSQSGSKRTSDA